jgi:hypothetical protein
MEAAAAFRLAPLAADREQPSTSAVVMVQPADAAAVLADIAQVVSGSAALQKKALYQLSQALLTDANGMIKLFDARTCYCFVSGALRLEFESCFQRWQIHLNFLGRLNDDLASSLAPILHSPFLTNTSFHFSCWFLLIHSSCHVRGTRRPHDSI